MDHNNIDNDIDELNWESFNKDSNLKIPELPSKVKEFNRLIMHTNNFFLIAGYGAFNEGYTMIVPKKIISSFALLEKHLLDEFYWFKGFVRDFLSKIYSDTNIALFEHGLCACLGGLDRAHLHLMPYKKVNKNNIVSSINYSLKRRNIGNQIVKYKDLILDKPDDIDFFNNNNNPENKDVQISGKIFDLNDIKTNYSINSYPINLYEDVINNKPYVFFDSGFEESSFITFQNIATQLGREIVFYIDYRDEFFFKEFLNNNKLTDDKSKFFWKWQDYNYDSNIISTIKKIVIYYNKNIKDTYDNEFNLKTYE